MTYLELLADLAQRGVQLWVEEDRLCYRAPKGALTREIMAALAEHKPTIVQMLQQQQSPSEAWTPLAYGQRALWFLYQIAPSSPMYNVAFAARICSPVDEAALCRAFQKLVSRHAMLRTRFVEVAGEPIQIVQCHSEVWFEQVDALGWSDEVLTAAVRAAYHQPFDLQAGPVLRVQLFKRAEQEQVLLIAAHHIVMDAWSLWLLLDELRQAYAAEIGGAALTLPPLAARYSDYVTWERARLAEPEAEDDYAYWQQQLAGAAPALDLPTDRPRPPMQTFRGASQIFQCDPALTARLKDLARAEGVTLYVLLLAAFNVLLYRSTYQDDILIGTPTFGRSQPEFTGLIGDCINMVAVRTRPSAAATFRSLLVDVRQTMLEALAHQHYPFPLLIERLQPLRDPSRAPLFQVSFVLQKPQILASMAELFVPYRSEAVIDFGGLQLRNFVLPQQEGQFDLTLEMGEIGSTIFGALKYNSDLFDAPTIERMAAQFQTLLAGIVADPAQRLAELPLLPAAERQLLLTDWNTTRQPVPAATLPDLFAAQVARTPDAPAIRFEATQLSYGELAARAAHLAQHLRALGVGPETRVGLCVERSLDLLVGVLGILQAGAAYVPLDPAYPAARRAFIVADAALAVLVTQRRLVDHLPAHQARLLLLDALPADTPALPPAPPRHPEQIAYVLYTSGSTGQPKGVAIPHRALVNFLASMQRQPGIQPHDRLLAVTTLAFDIAGLELFLPLISGAEVVLAPAATVADGDRLRQLLHTSQATMMQATPTTWRVLHDAGWSSPAGFRMLCGGEALPPALAADLLEGDGTLWNLYGPTETTIWSTLQRVERADALRIGQPIANTTIYIMDRQGQPTPIGVPGEILIGGEGLARGYWQRPDLTAERFVPDPFGSFPGGRLYRTGDLGRWRADGTIEYLGRIDHQVKVRGFRIELGEIETALRAQAAVHEAVVIVREDIPNDKRIVAYVIPEADQTPTINDLLTRLRVDLPDYMLPASFIFLDQLPLTPNGKIDRRSLPAPVADRPQLGVGYAAPQTELERTVAAIWQDVLRIEHIGLHDNFFDLGGHSLLLAQAHRRLQAALGREFPLVDLFRAPTIADVVSYLRDQDQAARFVTGVERLDTQIRQGRQRLSQRRSISMKGAAMQQDQRQAGIREGDIAIIAMAGRFPGAPTLDAFWNNLSAGIESISFFTDQELSAAGIDPAILAHPQYVKAGAILDDIDQFDAAFFDFNPREAEIMDPQHRLFLECAWEALERSGYTADSYDGAVGVYAGAGVNTYLLNNLYPNVALMESVGDFQAMIGNDKDFLATRVSYKLNLQGPSITVQTACSTSLVAVQLACQGLLSGECEIALAGGVSVRAPHRSGYWYQEGGVASPDGRCRAFDAKGQGTIFGNGVGIVVLKRLQDAIQDGDSILAVIKGAAVTNDGSAKVGYTAPRIDGQARAIRLAHLLADVSPDTIDYVETHGTGTALGDPIEVAALTQAFRQATQRTEFCALGAVKTNIGHVDAAAGVAGLIKAVLALQHHQIPPVLHYEQPNPAIDFASSPFYVATSLRDWPRNGHPRRAGVSSFGIGGTNVHVVLEEAPPTEKRTAPDRPQLLVLSAKTASALDTATAALADHLEQHPELSLGDVAYTLQIGRKTFNHRRIVVGQDRDDAIAALRDPQRSYSAVQEHSDRPVVFMFPGGGAQYAQMGRGLYETEATFRAEIDRCVELLTPLLHPAGTLDLRTLLYPEASQEALALERLEEPELALPALFATEYALARLWMSWGIQPQAMIGHSLGEYVAACLAGVLTLQDALALVVMRGRLFARLPAGAMLSVPLAEQELRALLQAGGTSNLSIAAINGPGLCVASGPADAIEALQQLLAERDIQARRLHIAVAAHSEMLTPILDDFAAFVAGISLHAPTLPYISNVTGTWITEAQATDPAYWVNHLRQTVRFADGLQVLAQEPARIFLEVGPGQTLSTFARQSISGHPVVLSSLRHPRDPQPDTPFLLQSLGRLWLAGSEIRWADMYAASQQRRVPLPTYPFERRRYWIEALPAAQRHINQHDPLRARARIEEWFYTPSWKQAALPPRARSLPEASATWLLLSDPHGLASQVSATLAQQGHQAILVTPGPVFARIGLNHYTIQPDRRDDYLALLKDLRAAGRTPDTIVHLWSITTAEEPQVTAETFASSQRQGFDSLLALVQALGDLSTDDPAQLIVVSNQLWSITGEEQIRPEKAPMLALCKIVPQEYQQITSRYVDIGQPASANLALLATQICSEGLARTGDPIVGYRRAHRWVQTFEPIALPLPEVNHPRLRHHGVYLITGGLGGVGLHIAEYLARTLEARLILTGRSPLPARSEWASWEAAQPDDQASQTIRRIRELEAYGAEVQVATADVTDREQMQQAIEQAYARFGRIDGVIHAAGVAGGGMIQLKTAAGVQSVLDPKVKGALLLSDLFAAAQLDFLVLVSSLSTILGGFGQVDYCAANSFLDAFARERASQGEPYTVTINWDRWAGVGMAVALEAHHKALTGEDLGAGLEPDAAVETLVRALASGLPQVAVSLRDLPTLAARYQELTATTALATLERLAPVQEAHARPDLGTTYVAPASDIEQAVADVWQQLLGIHPIGVHDNFFELGGHSLLATQIIARLRETFQVDISIQSVFDNPTISHLAQVIAQAKQGQQRQTPGMGRIVREQYHVQLSAEGEISLPESLKQQLFQVKE